MYREKRGLNKKGISDVVTVTLIILLAIAAIIIVWAFVRPTLERTGESFSTSAACLRVETKPLNCTISGGNANVNVQLVSTGGSTVTKVKATAKEASGTIRVGEAPAPTQLASTNVQVSGFVGATGTAKSAGVILDSNGNEVTCQESVVQVTCS